LYDRLADRFGEPHIFMDVDSIEPGIDFTKAIKDAVASCDVLLALIGRQWMILTDDRGRRRIDSPNDYVNLEIRTALERGIRVIPVLVEGAVMPDEDELPPTLRPLSRRHALEISHRQFRRELAYLVGLLEKADDGDTSRPRTDAVHYGKSITSPQWTLNRVEKSRTKRKLVISRKEIHEIEYVMPWGPATERIDVDGITIAENRGRAWSNQLIALTDEGEEFMATLTLEGSLLNPFRVFRLEINGELIYQE
jgi:hypothetical protein